MNEHSRSFNSARNISAGAIRQIVTLLLAFVTRTIFVRLLGAEYTGVNGLYNNILTVLSLAELGVGNVLVYSLYRPLKEHDIAKISSLTHYFKKIYNIIAVSIAGIGVAFIPFLSYIVKSTLPHDELVLYYVLYLANSVVSYFVVYKTTLIQADQKIYIQNLVCTIALVAQYIFQIVYLLVCKNFIGYLVIQVACTLLQNIVLNHIANRMYPFLKEKTDSYSSIDTKKMKDDIKAMFLYKISAVVINNTDNILISVMFGTIYVGYYSNYYSLITYVTTFVNLLVTGTTASIGNLNAEKNPAKSYTLFRNLIYMFNIVTAFCVAAFAAIVQQFIPIWLGSEYLMRWDTVFAILFSFYVSTVVNPVWMYRETMGMFKQIKYVMVVTALLNIVLSIIFGNWFGVAGIIGATGLSRLLTIVWYEPRILYRTKFGKNVSSYFGMQAKYLLINALSIAFSLFICLQLPEAFIWIPVKAVICGAVVLGVHYIFMHKSSEFNWIKEKVLSVLKRKRVV